VVDLGASYAFYPSLLVDDYLCQCIPDSPFLQFSLLVFIFFDADPDVIQRISARLIPMGDL
jgi:hypothetical protein